MANDNPDLYRISVGVRRINSPHTGKLLSVRHNIRRDAQSLKGKEALTAPAVILRIWWFGPATSLSSNWARWRSKPAEPALQIKWKSLTGKEWADAPVALGKRGQIPAKAGYGGQIYAFTAEVDLRTNLRLPAQMLSAKMTTMVGVDPEVIVDEC